MEPKQDGETSVVAEEEGRDDLGGEEEDGGQGQGGERRCRPWSSLKIARGSVGKRAALRGVLPRAVVVIGVIVIGWCV